MTEGLVLDANVIVKLLVEEPRSDLAQRLFDDPRFSFWTPAHAFAEVMEVVCRKIRSGAARERQAKEAAAELPGAFIVVPIEGLLTQAAELALRHSVAVYDALYVALAIERNMAMVTDDRRLVERLAPTAAGRYLVSLDSDLHPERSRPPVKRVE